MPDYPWEFSDRVSNKLRRIDPDKIVPIITDAEWDAWDKPEGFGEDVDRQLFERLIAYYRLNALERKVPPREIRKKLARKAQQLQGWTKVLSKLNNGTLFKARADVTEGRAAREKQDNAQAAVETICADLIRLASALKEAAKDLPREHKRARTQKSEVLHHLVYMLKVHVRLSKGLDEAEFARMAVWIFQEHADETLVPETIQTAAKRVWRELMNEMNDDGMTPIYLHHFHPTAITVWDPDATIE